MDYLFKSPKSSSFFKLEYTCQCCLKTIDTLLLKDHSSVCQSLESTAFFTLDEVSMKIFIFKLDLSLRQLKIFELFLKNDSTQNDDLFSTVSKKINSLESLKSKTLFKAEEIFTLEQEVIFSSYDSLKSTFTTSDSLNSLKIPNFDTADHLKTHHFLFNFPCPSCVFTSKLLKKFKNIDLNQICTKYQVEAIYQDFLVIITGVSIILYNFKTEKKHLKLFSDYKFVVIMGDLDAFLLISPTKLAVFDLQDFSSTFLTSGNFSHYSQNFLTSRNENLTLIYVQNIFVLYDKLRRLCKIVNPGLKMEKKGVGMRFAYGSDGIFIFFYLNCFTSFRWNGEDLEVCSETESSETLLENQISSSTLELIYLESRSCFLFSHYSYGKIFFVLLSVKNGKIQKEQEIIKKVRHSFHLQKFIMSDNGRFIYFYPYYVCDLDNFDVSEYKSKDFLNNCTSNFKIEEMLKERKININLNNNSSNFKNSLKFYFRIFEEFLMIKSDNHENFALLNLKNMNLACIKNSNISNILDPSNLFYVCNKKSSICFNYERNFDNNFMSEIINYQQPLKQYLGKVELFIYQNTKNFLFLVYKKSIKSKLQFKTLLINDSKCINYLEYIKKSMHVHGSPQKRMKNNFNSCDERMLIIFKVDNEYKSYNPTFRQFDSICYEENLIRFEIILTKKIAYFICEDFLYISFLSSIAKTLKIQNTWAKNIKITDLSCLNFSDLREKYTCFLSNIREPVKVFENYVVFINFNVVEIYNISDNYIVFQKETENEFNSIEFFKSSDYYVLVLKQINVKTNIFYFKDSDEHIHEISKTNKKFLAVYQNKLFLSDYKEIQRIDLENLSNSKLIDCSSFIIYHHSSQQNFNQRFFIVSADQNNEGFIIFDLEKEEFTKFSIKSKLFSFNDLQVAIEKNGNYIFLYEYFSNINQIFIYDIKKKELSNTEIIDTKESIESINIKFYSINDDLFMVYHYKRLSFFSRSSNSFTFLDLSLYIKNFNIFYLKTRNIIVFVYSSEIGIYRIVDNNLNIEKKLSFNCENIKVFIRNEEDVMVIFFVNEKIKTLSFYFFETEREIIQHVYQNIENILYLSDKYDKLCFFSNKCIQFLEIIN